MKKRFLSMILAIAMVVSIFAGITITASASGSYVKATSIAVGDTVVFYCENAGMELTAISTTSTKYGIGTAADANTLTGTMTFVVEAGASEGTYAFKNEAGYLYWKSGNSLSVDAALSVNSSWTVSFTEDGDAVIYNAADAARLIRWNKSSPRFACYTGKETDAGYYAPQIFKLDESACNHADATSETVVAATCTEAGTVKYTCSCGASWEEEIPALDHNYVDNTCTLCGDVKVVLEFDKVTTIVVGDEIVIVTEKSGNELVSVGTSYGSGAPYAETGITGTYILEVVAGVAEGTFAFANEGKYLAWKSGANSLVLSDAIDALSSWKVSFDENGNAVMINSSDEARQLWWNNSSPRFACYTDKTEGSQYHTIQFYTLSDGSCRHKDATSEATTAATCTETGVMTWTCPCGETWTTVIEALGHSYSVAVVDGAAAMVCATCGDAQTITLNTLAEAKAYTDKTVVYNVKGVVTYVSGRTVYIEDENDGLCVYFAADFDTSALNLGDEIFVSSTMTTYNGLPELDAPAAYYVLSTGNTLPENTVTLADLLADTTNEYLGERVTVEGLTVGIVNEAGSTTLTDKDGNSIALFKATGVSAIISEGDVITLTAIVSIYKTSYQFIVNPGTMDSDVVVTNEGGDVEIETVSIADAKLGATGEYYQVEGVVTAMSADLRTIYIQDATGAIALYLSKYPAEAACAIGDQVKAYGSWKNYGGLIELTEIDASNTKFFEILSSGNAVEAQTLEIAAILADTEAEHMAKKVRIEGAVITAIASNGTVTLEQNGATTVIFKAPALAENCTVGATVNVTAVVSSYNNTIQLLINEAADVVFVKACEHASVTVLEGIAATCTTDGLTEGAQCALCGTITVAQEVIPAGCTFVDGVCIICGAADPNAAPEEVSIKIGHTLNLASDISINFATTIASMADYSEFYLECTIPVYEGNTQTGTRTVKIQPVVNGSYYYFMLTGITAINMNDVIESRLHMTDGVKNYVSTVDTYSVATYAYAQFDKSSSPASLKALCADLLRYGAAAQTYKNYRLDALADAAMTDAQKAYLSDIDAVTFGSNKGDLGDYTNNGVSWIGRGLDLNSKVIVKFVFRLTDASLNPEELSAKITYLDYKGETVTKTVEGAVLYSAANNLYSFDFDGLLAAELRTVMNAVIYSGETRLSSTSVYSVDTYGNGTTGTMLALCKALIAYSDTALAYFNA